MMEERLYLIDLYDIYNELLNEKQREYFEYYYFDNLSLGEISDNINISRNGIHKVIKLTESKLTFYESKLKLYEKNKKLNEIIKNIDNEKIKSELEKISW